MKRGYLIAVLLMMMCGAAYADNLVIGGGFELPVLAAGSEYGLGTPVGWTGMGDLVIQGYAGAVSSGDGNQWFDLNPGFSGGTGISQTLSLTGGMEYQFSFLYNGGGTTSLYRSTMISFSLFSGMDTLFSDSVSTAAMDVYSGTPWAIYTNSFTPVSNTTATLQFMPNGIWCGTFIDAVTVSGAVVPEPSFLLLLGTGLGVIGLAAWRNRK